MPVSGTVWRAILPRQRLAQLLHRRHGSPRPRAARCRHACGRPASRAPRRSEARSRPSAGGPPCVQFSLSLERISSASGKRPAAVRRAVPRVRLVEVDVGVDEPGKTDRAPQVDRAVRVRARTAPGAGARHRRDRSRRRSRCRRAPTAPCGSGAGLATAAGRRAAGTRALLRRSMPVRLDCEAHGMGHARDAARLLRRRPPPKPPACGGRRDGNILAPIAYDGCPD